MSLEAFVRAAGGVMGRAREGFGSGAAVACDCPLAPVPPGETPAGQGASADAHQRAATTLTTDSRRLAQQDIAGDTQLAAAVAQSHSGRRSMDAVISAAIADVEAMGLSTGTPQGKAALIAAIERRLLDTKATVGEGTTDAGTHAAASEATAAGYRGIGTDPRAATMPAQMPMSGMPMGGMPAMGGMPQMGGGGLSSVMPTSALQGLSSLAGQGSSSLRRFSGADGDGGASTRTVGALNRPGLAPEKGLQKYTKLLNRAITEAFPEIREIGGVRSDALKWHPQGLALDVMIPNANTAAGKALGDRVVKFLVANHERLGVAHMIWRQRMIQPDGSSSLMQGRGSATANHFDHVHVASIGGGY
jgi:hypothetical protein